ncbi:uncharacterized protein LOC110853429 [Folsomia candida]|uniref:Uncharacterized protein n=1 Tax=Folsomia candida TaxID=158441 RepID=A0A226E022_FOLCA|nr:uncharacterized protein LOC110853429 [Folsomia candida]OXA51072.1 hypothetical protein Fcan01_14583 [Folsomia candida]
MRDYYLIFLVLFSTSSFVNSQKFSKSLNSSEGIAPDFIVKPSFQSHNKFTIQSVIAQRDREKWEHPQWWRAYFAELLAALLLVVAAVIFFIWWCYTEKKYGPISIPVDEEGRPYLYSRHGRIRSASTTALPEMVIHHPNRRASTSTGFPKCSKPACVCAVPQKSEVGRGNKWRQWRNTIKNEDTEVYGPANKV